MKEMKLILVFPLINKIRTSESRPQVLSDLRACQEEIEREKTNLQRCNTRVLQLSQLKDVITVQQFYQLAYEEYKYNARKESVVEAWLGIQRSQGKFR